jgi:peptidoglycan hydrolase CwlO-like protein
MDNEILSILMSLKEEIGGINNKLDNLNPKIDKNTLMLEELNNKIDVIAEVQTSFSEQLDRAKDKDGKSLADRLNLIELAITDT